MIDPEKLPTFTAVALGTGLLALLLAAVSLREARTAGVATAGLMQGTAGYHEDLDQRVKGLEARLAALEASKALPPPAPAPEPAPAPAP